MFVHLYCELNIFIWSVTLLLSCFCNIASSPWHANTSETPLITGMLLMWIKQVAYMGLVGSFPFNSFLSGVLSCIGTAVLAGRSFLPSVALLPWLHDMTDIKQDEATDPIGQQIWLNVPTKLYLCLLNI